MVVRSGGGGSVMTRQGSGAAGGSLTNLGRGKESVEEESGSVTEMPRPSSSSRTTGRHTTRGAVRTAAARRRTSRSQPSDGLRREMD